MLNIRDINKAMKGNDSDHFSVDQVEAVGSDLHLIVSMYKCEGASIVGKICSWQIICEDMRESNIGFGCGFTYLRQLKDHPILFKYNKPYYRIWGPLQLQNNDELCGRIIYELLEFLDTYNARERIYDFMPQRNGRSEDLVHLTFGPQEIIDIYNRVLGSRGFEVTLWPDCQNYTDTGTEQILIFNNPGSGYVVAEKFHVTRID